MSLNAYVVTQTHLPEKAVSNTLQLLQEDASIPFYLQVS